MMQLLGFSESALSPDTPDAILVPYPFAHKRLERGSGHIRRFCRHGRPPLRHISAMPIILYHPGSKKRVGKHISSVFPFKYAFF